MRRRASKRRTQFSIFAGRIGVVATLLLALVSLISAQVPAAKAVGTVKSISGRTLVVTPDAAAETTIMIAESARLLRTSPGQTDLKTATPISASDIQVGDRVLVRGQAGDNGALLAFSVIVMSKSDIAQRQQQEREEWRKGVGGIVKSIDTTAGAITLANSLLASGKPIVVHVGEATKFSAMLQTRSNLLTRSPERWTRSRRATSFALGVQRTPMAQSSRHRQSFPVRSLRWQERSFPPTPPATRFQSRISRLRSP